MKFYRRKTTARYRYWVAILYTENLSKSWKTDISKVITCPFCYCVHEPESEDLKEHVHLMLMFKGPVTEKSVKGMLSELDADKDKPACHNQLQNIQNTHSIYEYLIHADDESKLAGKIQYSPEDRILGNGFDIENFDYELKRENKNKRLKWLLDSIVDDESLVDMKALYCFLRVHRSSEFDRYVSIIKKNVMLVSKFLECNKETPVKKARTVQEIVNSQKPL